MPNEVTQTLERSNETEFNPDDFLNGGRPWKVFTEGRGTVSIVKLGEMAYRITYDNGQHDPQDLVYNPRTRSLDSDPQDPNVVRSVAYWDGPDDRRTVFATFSYRANGPDEDHWPIEKGGKGTWGADDG